MIVFFFSKNKYPWNIIVFYLILIICLFLTYEISNHFSKIHHKENVLPSLILINSLWYLILIKSNAFLSISRDHKRGACLILPLWLFGILLGEFSINNNFIGIACINIFQILWLNFIQNQEKKWLFGSGLFFGIGFHFCFPLLFLNLLIIPFLLFKTQVHIKNMFVWLLGMLLPAYLILSLNFLIFNQVKIPYQFINKDTFFEFKHLLIPQEIAFSAILGSGLCGFLLNYLNNQAKGLLKSKIAFHLGVFLFFFIFLGELFLFDLISVFLLIITPTTFLGAIFLNHVDNDAIIDLYFLFLVGIFIFQNIFVI